MFELLERIGGAGVGAFWIPVVVWTGLAGMAAVVLGRAGGLHPIMGYRLRQALLLALPTSVLASPWVPSPWMRTRHPSAGPWLPTLADSSAASPLSGGLLPSEAPNGPAVDIVAAVLGLLTVSAILLAFIRLARLAAELRRLSALRVAAPPVGDRASLQLLRSLGGRLGVRRPVKLLEGPQRCVPMTFGVWRPVVVIPRALLDSPDSLRAVLAHELVHVRRADYIWALLDCVTSSMFAFHPLVWRLRGGIERSRETSCDAEVMAMRTVRPSEYAQALVRTHASVRFPMTAIAASLSSARAIGLRARLEIMRRFAGARLTPARRLRAVLASVCLLLVVATLGAGATSTREKPALEEWLPVVVPSTTMDRVGFR